MKTFYNPAQYHRAWANRLDRHASDVKKGVADLARASRLDWMTFTRGSVSSRELRAMGHPFGRTGAFQRGQTRAGRRGRFGPQFTTRGVLRPLPINRQTGRLYAGIRMVQAGSDAWEISSSAPYARYILAPEGTSKMVGRGFSGVSPSLAVRLNTRSTSRFDGAVTKAWRSRNAALLTNLRKNLKQ